MPCRDTSDPWVSQWWFAHQFLDLVPAETGVIGAAAMALLGHALATWVTTHLTMIFVGRLKRVSDVTAATALLRERLAGYPSRSV